MKDPFELDGEMGWIDPFAEDPVEEAASAKEEQTEQKASEPETTSTIEPETAPKVEPRDESAVVSEPAPIVEPTVGSAKSAGRDSFADENNRIQLLKTYKELLDQGVITQEDFDAKKQELLGFKPTESVNTKPPKAEQPKADPPKSAFPDPLDWQGYESSSAKPSESALKSEPEPASEFKPERKPDRRSQPTEVQIEPSIMQNRVAKHDSAPKKFPCPHCDGYLLSADQKICPFCKTPVKAKRRLGMKWNKFLSIVFLLVGIYFILNTICSFVLMVVGCVYGDQLANAMSLSGLAGVVVSGILAYLALKTKAGLDWNKKKGPIMLFVMLNLDAIAVVVALVAYVLMLLNEILNYVDAENIVHILVDHSLEMVLILIGLVVYLLFKVLINVPHIIYYYKRRHIFVYS